MSNAKKGFVLYFDSCPMLEALPPEQRGWLLSAVYSYADRIWREPSTELGEILDQVACADRVGVCLDTCHMSDAGYDLTGDLDGVLTRLDRTVGLRRVKAVHINDSQNPPGARKDRHAPIGEGTLGLEGILRVMTHPALRHLSFLLETPWDDAGHGREIALLRAAAAERIDKEE